MRNFQIGLVLLLAALGGFVWWAALDGAAPAHTEGAFDLAAYRRLVAADAPETLPTEVRVETTGSSQAPSFAAITGAFDGQRTFSYNSFQVVAPGGDIIIDGGVDAATLNAMSDGKGHFDAEAYQRVLDAMEHARIFMITHEHLDHVMAVARHPHPEAITPHLLLTPQQLAGLPPHAPNGVLAPAIAQLTPTDFTTPRRIAPGVVAAAAPGHSPGSIVIYVRGAAHEYLFIGDIAWVMDSVGYARGRPRFIHWIMPGVDPDRPAVLRQLRELHDMAYAEPALIMIAAHDDAYLRGELEAKGEVIVGFSTPPPLVSGPAAQRSSNHP